MILDLDRVPICLRADKEYLDWLTGFWEGDGHCCITKSNSVQVSFAQAEPEVLLDIYRSLGLGRLYLQDLFILYYHGTNARNLLDSFSSRLVCRERVTQVNRLFTVLGKPRVTEHKPTDDWVVGFWDAEGSIICGDSSLRLGISQKDVEVLRCIQSYLGCGRVVKSSTTSSWYIRENSDGGNFSELAELLLEKSLNTPKREKLELALRLYPSS